MEKPPDETVDVWVPGRTGNVFMFDGVFDGQADGILRVCEKEYRKIVVRLIVRSLESWI
ncbi:MAG: hypothetical protein QHI48_11940 [Bacteroidota bacterium]|nr:hypothetical protein [Bacteroidota bacterium]